jgi:hypothetical protein
MKKIVVLLVFSSVALTAQAQSLSSSVIGSAGEQAFSASGALEWTLGEIMTETYQESNGYFTQGFQQPATIKVTSLEEAEEKNLWVYPNPTQGVLNIKTTENGDYLFELFDMQGQKVVSKNSVGVAGTRLHQIDLQEFRVAIYLLRVANSTNGKNTYHKIEKL